MIHLSEEYVYWGLIVLTAVTVSCFVLLVVVICLLIILFALMRSESSKPDQKINIVEERYQQKRRYRSRVNTADRSFSTVTTNGNVPHHDAALTRNTRDFSRSSPETKVIQEYLCSFKDALELLVGLDEITSHFYQEKVISFDMYKKVIAKEVSNPHLLLLYIQKVFTVRMEQHLKFKKLIACLNLYEELSDIALTMESYYFSLIRMKLVEQYEIQPQLKNNCFVVTLQLFLMDDRVQDDNNTLWVILELQENLVMGEHVQSRPYDDVEHIVKGTIGITLYNDSNLPGPLYRVATINSSQLGTLELELMLYHPNSEYRFDFRLTQLIVKQKSVMKFNCTDKTVTIPTGDFPSLRSVCQIASSSTDHDSVCSHQSFQMEWGREYIYMSYEAELRGENCDEICEQYRLALVANSWKETLRITKQITLSSTRTPAEKAFYMCYHAIQLSHSGKDSNAKELLFQALNMITDRYINNELLVKARILRIYAGICASEGDNHKALELLNKCKKILETARPSCEKACVLIREAIIRQKLGGDRELVAQLFESAEQCILQCTDTKRKTLMLPMASVERALFLLNSTSNKHDTKRTSHSVSQAKECLQHYKDCKNIKGRNVYHLKFLVAQSDVSRLSDEWSEANRYLCEAKNLLETGVVKITSIDKEELRINEKMVLVSKKIE